MEALIGGVLLVGLLSSVVLIATGLVWHWAATHTLWMDYPLPATDVGAFIVADIRQAASLTTGPRRLVSLGIGILMITPYVRVLASLLYFLMIARNWKYVTFTGIVLATLTYTLFY